ncbi:MAG: ClpXP protease specificity-enhancing factor [Nitrosomonas sp.]|nr:ClpXP protease specificity-enhancing factor [Nitrosomonas sp.]MDP1950303.1 ClpXP protease specificity-enhancing factor [Nitrosomonas sp.]
MNEKSTKPYLIRAIYEWCVDSGFSPYIIVQVNSDTEVPIEHIKDGEIILNISHTAVSNLEIGNEILKFSARFNGISRRIQVPISTIKGIFSKEVNQGLTFFVKSKSDIENSQDTNQTNPDVQKQLTPSNSKSHLQVVK